MAESMVRCRRTDTGQELDYREAVARVLAAKVPPRVEVASSPGATATRASGKGAQPAPAAPGPAASEQKKKPAAE